MDIGPFTDLCYDMGTLADKNRSIKSSVIGGVQEIQEMLQFCSKKNIIPDIEKIPITDINQTYDKLINSDVKYRFVIDMERK